MVVRPVEVYMPKSKLRKRIRPHIDTNGRTLGASGNLSKNMRTRLEREKVMIRKLKDYLRRGKDPARLKRSAELLEIYEKRQARLK